MSFGVFFSVGVEGSRPGPGKTLNLLVRAVPLTCSLSLSLSLPPSLRCTPIYLGAADIAAFIPAPSAIIDYRALGGTPEALAAELVRLNADASAWAENHAWRALPPAGWAPAFRRLVARGSMEHTQCQICRRTAMHRAQWRAGVVGGGGGDDMKKVVVGVSGGGFGGGEEGGGSAEDDAAAEQR